MAKAQTRASNKYQAKAYDRIAVQVKKGEREKIKEYAEKNGETVNGMIIRLIYDEMKKDSQ